MSKESESSSARSHPLAGVSGVPASVAAALKSRWIETAEQVLAGVATAQGREGIKRLLSFDDQELDGLLEILTREVGPEAAVRLSNATRGGALGVVLTPEQKRRLGMKD